MELTGRTALVTGAAGRGMGRSIALTLAREEANVVVNYRTSEDSAKAIVEQVAGRGGQSIALQADVFEPDGCKQLVNAAVERFGQVDICIIGPGAGWHDEPLDRLDPADALSDARQELAPIYHLMPLVLPGMYQRKWGRVIAIALDRPYDSPAYAYSVAKAARAHAMLLARDQAWRNDVTLNVIGPGPVPEIESLAEALEQCDHGPTWQSRKSASPQDIAEGVAFLCSEVGRFISACELPYMFH